MHGYVSLVVKMDMILNIPFSLTAFINKDDPESRNYHDTNSKCLEANENMILCPIEQIPDTKLIEKQNTKRDTFA